MNITPPPTDRQTKSNQSAAPAVTPAPIANIPPIENLPMPEITPFDARKLRFNEDFPMRDVSDKPVSRNRAPIAEKPPTLASIPSSTRDAAAAENEKAEKARNGPRQSEISSQIDPREVCQEILDTTVSLPLRKLLGTSKELSVSMQEIIKFKNMRPTHQAITPVPPEEPTRSVRNAVYNSTTEPRPKPNLEELLIRLTLYCEGRPIQAVIDTGSQLNVISEDLALETIRKPIDLTKAIRMKDANGGEGYLKGMMANVLLTCGPNETLSDIHVGENVSFDFLLGRPWQRGNYVSIDERLQGTFLVFKNPRTLKVQSEIFVTPDSMTPRTFASIRPSIQLVTAASPPKPIDEMEEEDLIEFDKFLYSDEAPTLPVLTFDTDWFWDSVDPLSMLRSSDDVSELAQQLEVVADVPEDDPGPLGKLQRRLRGIEMRNDDSQHKLEQQNELLSCEGSKEQAKEAVIRKLNEREELEAENVRLIEFLGRNVVERILTECSESYENIESPYERESDAIDNTSDITNGEEPVEEIISPQLMNDENSPRFQSTNTESIASIQFVAHHVESTHQHAHYPPNPHFSASFTTQSAVLAGIGYRESQSLPLTFLEVTGDPAEANFHAQGEDF